jgi:hypothetical protein
MDTLGELSGSSSESEDGSDAPPEDDKPAAKKKKLAAKEPAPEELEKLGYKSGPSILFVPEPHSAGNPNWEW